jgi:hypothetical protein
MWLRVEVTDLARRRLFVSGDYDPATAVLAPDAQLKVYEAKPAIAGQGPTFHFVRNDSYAVDNRIPPLGFRPDLETRPWGYAYPDLGGGRLAHWDDSAYRFTLGTAPLYPLTVTATLLYQTASRDYIEFLRDENRTSDRGRRMHDLWQRHGMSPPVEMVQATAVIGDPAPALAPADVGNTLRLWRAGTDELALRWRNAPVDAGHDPATVYEVWASAAAAGPWAPRLDPVLETPVESEARDPGPLAAQPLLLYRVVGRNSGGTSELP